eukprot:Skav208564  [mRNA]  locus=scaffold177:35717:39900:+ [translate_table: standard]
MRIKKLNLLILWRARTQPRGADICGSERFSATSFVQQLTGAEQLGEGFTAAENGLDLKRHLLEIRAGIHDEKILKPCKAHSDEQIIERYKFVVAMTGQGPIGKLTGKWFNAIDERGLPAHCVADHWNDWNGSYSTHSKEDIQQAHAVVQQQDDRCGATHLLPAALSSPGGAIANMNDRLRERKVDFQDLKVS